VPHFTKDFTCYANHLFHIMHQFSSIGKRERRQIAAKFGICRVGRRLDGDADDEITGR
jgi:hypothetical protein